jgi:hypothetical protein
MIRAFGFCNDTFDTLSPGRLCRGRERWIEGIPDTPGASVARTVCSGAIFTDDSARDARRGFRYSGVSAGHLLHALFPRDPILAFCEAGDPLALPPERLLEEDHDHAIGGGSRTEPAVRWIAAAKPADVDLWMEGEFDAPRDDLTVTPRPDMKRETRPPGLAAPRADGFLIGGKASNPALAEAIYHLVGFSEPDDRPARRYCPAAIPEVLEHVRALVLLHLDKHAPVLAIYTKEPLHSDGVLDLTARAAGAFPVPFAIPPMLARWDRALYELRMDWDPEHDGEFPVPPADDAGRWSSRRRHTEEAAETPEEE